MMSDPLLAQSAIDRLTSTAHELVIEGQSYRRRQKPSVDSAKNPTTMLAEPKQVVPSRWLTSGPITVANDNWRPHS